MGTRPGVAKDSAVSYCFPQMMVLNDLVCPLILVRVEGISKDLYPRAWVNVVKQVQKDVSSLCQWEKMYIEAINPGMQLTVDHISTTIVQSYTGQVWHK